VFGHPDAPPFYARGVPETWWYDRDKAAKIEKGGQRVIRSTGIISRVGKGARLRAVPTGLGRGGHAEPVIGPAHRVRPLAGPMAGSGRTRWLYPPYDASI